MAASVVLRWRVSDLECEVRINGADGKVSVRQEGQILRSAIVGSASAAHEWANQQVEILAGKQRRTG
jgi:hypothetical protein